MEDNTQSSRPFDEITAIAVSLFPFFTIYLSTLSLSMKTIFRFKPTGDTLKCDIDHSMTVGAIVEDRLLPDLYVLTSCLC